MCPTLYRQLSDFFILRGNQYEDRNPQRHLKEPVERLYSIAVGEREVHQYGGDMGRMITCVRLFVGQYPEAIGAAGGPHHAKGSVTGIDQHIANGIGVGTILLN